MAVDNCTQCGFAPQISYAELSQVLDAIDCAPLLERLQAYRHTGRPGYPLLSLWRSYIASYFLNLGSTNDLIRLLHVTPDLREVCGFDPDATLPHRTTFNRFIRRVADHADLVEAAFISITDQLHEYLPDLGKEVAVDSTAVWSYSNPHRRVISDPDASWTAKNSAHAKGGKEWTFGYKVHMVVDVNYGVPLAQIVTTANQNDFHMLPEVVQRSMSVHGWFQPEVVIADKGYDSMANHTWLDERGIVPIIHLRKAPKGDLHEGIYTNKGVPTCMGQVPMEFVRSDPELGRLYRCRSQGCELLNSKMGGIRHCDDVVWEDPRRNIRLFGVVRRDGPEWTAYYRKRQAIERVFKSMKQSRRLTRHCIRGFLPFHLHGAVSTLVYQATALVRVLEGDLDWMRWMVRKVA